MPLTPEERAQILADVRTAVTEIVDSRQTAPVVTPPANTDEEITTLRAEVETLRNERERNSRRAAIYANELPGNEMGRIERREMLVNHVGDIVRATAAAKGNPAVAADIVRKRYKNERAADFLTRGLTEGVFADGGALVETQYSSDLIELLYPMAVVRALGARVIPMPLGNVTIPKVQAGVTGAYQGEIGKIATQQQALGQLSLSAKKLAVLIPVSNDLINDTSGRVNAIIVRDLGQGLSLREDLAFLRGDGQNNTPVGIRNAIPAGNVLAASSGLEASPTLAEVLNKLRAKVLGANVSGANLGWAFNADFEASLYGKLTTTGAYVYRDEMDAGRLMGYPFKRTTQIASNYSTTLTEVYFGDWSEFVIGETDTIRVDTSTEGSYWDGSAWVSAFGTDQTLIRGIARHDGGVRHSTAFAVATVGATIS
jgi:HK97 family phage major capsid protein